MEKKKFAVAAFDSEHETYIIYITSFSSTSLVTSSGSTLLNVHSSWRLQIFGLIAKNVFTKVFNKYANFADVFFSDLTSESSKHTKIINHTIELINGQQPPHRPIYSLGPVELKTLNAFIETNLANGFIRPSKSPTDTPILFDRKLDSFFRLCINY